ncbi:hypothetical protein ACJJTC_008088 [Scirpophaga incertulas]
MADNSDIQSSESLPDLDDLLQCPVCYEIPSGQIFQCNEGHHVCGRCKMRLDMCPVCRALFFGTRNYAMEELIANVKKLRAFKLGGKITTGTDTESNQDKDSLPADPDPDIAAEEESNAESSNSSTIRAHQACKGLFRCLCCKNGNGVRLPLARLLNHLRYHHAPELIEGQSENGQYVQAWQFSTVPGRIVTAVRVADMGIFFLNIEITDGSICAWLSMAASPWVAHEFSYTITISGNDREAIFSDCVWSVRSCEGSLKKRGHCLLVRDGDAEALSSPATLNGRLTVRRTPPEQLTQMPPPRAVLRVANRGNAELQQSFEPLLQGLQDDVERLTRAFATLGREADALVRSEAEMRARVEANQITPRNAANAVERAQIEHNPRNPDNVNVQMAERPLPTVDIDLAIDAPDIPMSRNARRRLRRRLREALNDVLEQRHFAINITNDPVFRDMVGHAHIVHTHNPPRVDDSNYPRDSTQTPPRVNAQNPPRINVHNTPRVNGQNFPPATTQTAHRGCAQNPPRDNAQNYNTSNHLRSNVSNPPRSNASISSRSNASNPPRANGTNPYTNSLNPPTNYLPNGSHSNAPTGTRTNITNARSNAPNTRRVNVPNSPRTSISNASPAIIANTPRASAANDSVVSTSNPRNASSLARNNAITVHSRNNGTELQNGYVHMTGLAIVQPPVPPQHLPSGSRNGHPQNDNQPRTNKKRRRQRR